MLCESLDRKSEITGQSTRMYPLATNPATYTKSIDMLSKNTPGVKKSEAKSEAPVSSYSYMRLKSVMSG